MNEQLNRWVNQIISRHVRPLERAMQVGPVDAVEHGRASVILGGNEAPTPGAVVPPHIGVRPGDLVLVFRLGPLFHVMSVLNRNAVDPAIVAGVNVSLSQTDEGVEVAAVPFMHRDEGSPEGVIVADRGAVYLRTDGGTTTTMYVKTGGDGLATGWTAK
jgi:hypothetical protein